jgi:hypothetical protein
MVELIINRLRVVEVRISPSEIRSSPLVFDTRDTGSSQSAGTIDISGDNVATTSGKTSMTSSTSSEEHKGTYRGVSVVVSVSFGGSLPVDKGSVEATSRTTIGQTNKMITHSLVFLVVAVGQMSFSPSDGLTARSGVLETSRAVATRRSRSRSRVATASMSTLSVAVDVSSTDVSSLGRNVEPGSGSTREARNSVTTNLTINFEVAISGDAANNIGVGIGGTSDVKGLRSSVNSSSETQD